MRPPTSGEWARNVGDTVTETVIADEWGTEHLPLTSVALADALPIIEAEVRAKIAAQIHDGTPYDAADGHMTYLAGYIKGREDAARIAGGST